MTKPTQPTYAAPVPKYTPEELRRVVTAPIAASLLREHFVNRDILFVIDYKNSSLKGMRLLTYLSNLDMPADIQWDLNDYDEYAELLGAYFSQRAVVKCDSLAALAGEVLMHFARIPRDQRPFSSPVSEEFLSRFCNEHLDELAIWSAFLQSTLLYAGLRLYPGLIDDDPNVRTVNDPDAVGHNVVNLVKAPDFLTQFITMSSTHFFAYFKPQFDTPMFGGYTLAYYFMCPSNSLTQFLDPSNMAKMSEELRQVLERISPQPEQKDTPT